MHVSRLASLALLLFVASAVWGCAGDRGPELNVVIGYADLTQDSQGGFEPIVDNQGGLRTSVGIDGPVLLTDESNGSGLRLGGRFAFSGYREDLGDRVVAGEPLLEIEEFADLGIFAPMATASYRQVFGDPDAGGAAFIEPGIGAGLSVGVLSFGSELQFGDRVIGSDIDESQTEVSYVLNPFMRGGYTSGQFAIGLEGGYQWTGLEFDDDLGVDAREWYLGLFFGFRLGVP